MKLLSGIKPDLYYRSIFDIDLEELRRKGIKNLLIDLDNTLVPWGEEDVTERLISWLESLRESGFKACILSNNVEKRASYLSSIFGLPYIALAKKPSKKAFEKGLAKLKAKKKETAVIGDQIFTDVLGGKRSGLFTVLVIPLSRNEFIGTKVVRLFERLILRLLYGKYSRSQGI